MRERRRTVAVLLALLAAATPPDRGSAQEAVGLDGAEAALEAGRSEEARAVVERWLAAPPAGAAREETARARWLRARLTADADSAERDYAWVAVEGGPTYGPLARLALAQLRLARGEASRALEDLGRLRADFPESEIVARSWVWTGHAREAAGDAAGACEAWRRALAVGGSDRDAHEEASVSLAGCPGGGVVAGGPSAADGRTGDGAPSSAEAAAPPASGVSLQVGAFRSREPAERLRGAMAIRGVPARVERPEEPGGWFRVRAGPFADRQEALAVRERLRQEGYEAIVLDEP